MGLPSGWICELPIPRTAQLRALGNSVVPQQAAHAVRLLLADLHQLAPSGIADRHGEHADEFDGQFYGVYGEDCGGVAA